MAYSPDGRSVATSQVGGLVRVWRMPVGDPPPRWIADHDPAYIAARLSDDGRYLVAARPETNFSILAVARAACTKWPGAGRSGRSSSWVPAGGSRTPRRRLTVEFWRLSASSRALTRPQPAAGSACWIPHRSATLCPDRSAGRAGSRGLWPGRRDRGGLLFKSGRALDRCQPGPDRPATCP